MRNDHSLRPRPWSAIILGVGVGLLICGELVSSAAAQSEPRRQPPRQVGQGNPNAQGDGGLTIGSIGLIDVHANSPNGLVVSETIADSLAAANGLEPGDVLLRVNGRSLRQPQDLNAALSDAGGGADVNVEGVNVRDGSPINFDVHLPDDAEPRLGVRTFANRTAGVRIGEVDPNGIIAQVGNLERGDLITRVNGRSVRTNRELEQALARVAGGEEVAIDGINVRDGQPFETVRFRAGE